MKILRLFFFLGLLTVLSSCKDEIWAPTHMTKGAILNFTSHGKHTRNYEAKFYEGEIKSVSSDMALGVTPISNKLFRVQSGKDGKPENLWLPAGRLTVVVINYDTKSYAFTTFDSTGGAYAVIKADFDNTTDCGCGKLFREKWDQPITFVN